MLFYNCSGMLKMKTCLNRFLIIMVPWKWSMAPLTAKRPKMIIDKISKCAMKVLTRGAILSLHWHCLLHSQCDIAGGCNISIQHGDLSSVFFDGVSVGWVIGADWHSQLDWHINLCNGGTCMRHHLMITIFMLCSSQSRLLYFGICNIVGIQGGDMTITFWSATVWVPPLPLRASLSHQSNINIQHGDLSSVFFDGVSVGWVIGAGWYSQLDSHINLCNGDTCMRHQHWMITIFMLCSSQSRHPYEY